MNIPALDLSAAPAAGTLHARLKRIYPIAVSAALLCFATTSCTRTQVALSSAAIAAVVVGTTVGVTLAVQHSHHTLQGCIYTNGNGLKLRTSDAHVYAIEGEIADVKPGDRLKLHGSKVKRHKGDLGDQVFVVEKVNKDYGSCPSSYAASASPAQ